MGVVGHAYYAKSTSIVCLISSVEKLNPLLRKINFRQRSFQLLD